MVRYIIFDFDGTLANTNGLVLDSWQETLRHYLGHELPERVIEATYGEVLVATMAKLIPGTEVDEAVEYFRAYQDSLPKKEMIHAFDGVTDLLVELRRRGCLIGVGTSRTANTFHDYMTMLGMYELVDEVVTMNDVTRHKPDPETAEAVLKKLAAHDGREWSDALRKEAIFIGDTKYDIGCAQNAGIDSVLAGWSHYVDEEDMAASGFAPTYKIKKPAELLELI